MSNDDVVRQPAVQLPPKVNGAPDLLRLAQAALTPPPMPEVLAAPGREISPPVAPPGQKIDEADRLAIENIFLRMQNSQLQLQNLEHKKNEVVMGMKELQTMMEAKREELSKKYGVVIGPKSLAPDGTIITPKA